MTTILALSIFGCNWLVVTHCLSWCSSAVFGDNIDSGSFHGIDTLIVLVSIRADYRTRRMNTLLSTVPTLSDNKGVEIYIFSLKLTFLTQYVTIVSVLRNIFYGSNCFMEYVNSLFSAAFWHCTIWKFIPIDDAWWRHQMDTFSALLALCAGNSPVTGEFPAQRPVTRSFDGFFDLRLNKQLCKQSWGWWFETPSRSLCHYNDRMQ